RQLDLERGVGLLERGEDRRQHLDRDDLAGADADRARDRRARARGGPAQRGRGRGEPRGERAEIARDVGRDQPGRRPREQLDAERLLERVDVAADGRLGQAELARRGGQRSVVEDAEERAVQVPGRLAGHTKVYIDGTRFDNSVYQRAGAWWGH